MFFDGFPRSSLTPSIRLGPQKTQVGRAGAVHPSVTLMISFRNHRQSLGVTNGNSALEGILTSHPVWAPKSSEAGSFYFERPPGKDTQKPLFGGAITVLTALTCGKFNPPNSSPASANTS